MNTRSHNPKLEISVEITTCTVSCIKTRWSTLPYLFNFNIFEVWKSILKKTLDTSLVLRDSWVLISLLWNWLWITQQLYFLNFTPDLTFEDRIQFIMEFSIFYSKKNQCKLSIMRSLPCMFFLITDNRYIIIVEKYSTWRKNRVLCNWYFYRYHWFSQNLGILFEYLV